MKYVSRLNLLNVLSNQMTFLVLLNTLLQKGNLVYEYNPLRNYRITETSFYYKNKWYSPLELAEEINLPYLKGTDETVNIAGKTYPIFKTGDKYETNDLVMKILSKFPDMENLKYVLDTSTDTIITVSVEEPVPILYEPGELADFLTNELSFDLTHPVDIIPLYSYDGSVNLIINDGKNLPRLINSRFSPVGRNLYEIIDRKGDNDTNIYDQGDLFDVDTSLYKRTTTVAKLQFTGISYSGSLPIGNYHFYFRYEDADGNLTDYIAESGLVSIFIGTDPYNIHSGFRDLNSYKGCTFLLSDLDPSYQYISVYYTRDTSDISESGVTVAYKIELKYLVNNANMCNVLITGYEDTTEVTLEEINPRYLIAADVFTLASCLNMLFLANIHKPDIPYRDLLDLSLRFIPNIELIDYNITDKLGNDYSIKSNETYYNPEFIYNKTGYWPDEIYRFGIVYILSDNTLSPVFNVRGGYFVNDTQETFHNISVYKNGSRNYISFDELTFLISDEEENVQVEAPSYISLENAKGVVHFPLDNSVAHIYGITFKILNEQEEEVKEEFKKLRIKGFFFVRLKRIPTTLCEAFTIGVDKYSHLPAIPVNDEYLVELLLNEDLIISHDLSTYALKDYQVDFAAICPEYDVNPQYYNTLFSGDNYILSEVALVTLTTDQFNLRHFIASSANGNNTTYPCRIIAVNDNTKLVGLEDLMFSARAGEAEEGFRYEYVGYENKVTKATNITRGSYGPYLGLTGYVNIPHSIVDIKIPNYSSASMSNYFLIRYQDKSSYFAISDRYSLEEVVNNTSGFTCYRGDCYVCQFTHRVNRNFSDPSAPTNDKIVDEDCWKDHYEIEDEVVKTENFDEINLGDLNAKKMGLWVTILLRSTRNLCIRALDDSIPDEVALYGLPRAFYPYLPMKTDGVYKIPEALCYNDGFSKGLSLRYNFEIPDVPYIKNEFTNRILYSDIHVNDAFTNGFRTFLDTHYRDYSKTYGQITKIIEFRENLVCIFEHGVALIAVNERAIAGEGAGGNVYINTSNVLPENPKIISDKYGSLWRESIIKTPLGIYGVDTVGKKIWRTDGETFECISDFRVLEFLNLNISLTERELEPVIGIRNVKTHYNAFKQDVMFTFYNNLYGFEEKVWNLCWNELLLKFVTFYSWVPSYSENIYNQYFSFDRNTSKWIAKLGVSNYGNDFSDGITIENNIITESGLTTTLHLSNRVLPTGDDVEYSIEYSLERDNYGNYKLFKISGDKLTFTGDYNNVTSEFYERTETGLIKTNDRGRRIWLSLDELKNPDKIVLLLNIKANIKVSYKGSDNVSLGEAYASGYTDRTFVDAGYYESTIALIPEYNMQFLTTDFWLHGQAGVIDIADKIYPTYWYGKQHPFEFEFVVAEDPDKHKIFDNLLIISNNAEPESFHYEIIGDCYNFAKDKKNMYIRLEATKELYQYNGSDITYDHKYIDLESIHRPLKDSDGKEIPGYFDKSTLLPLYYSRLDTINDIEDYYHLKDGTPTKDFSALSGGEIVYYETLDEYRIWNHTKAVDMQSKGRLRGNMLYNEDKWCVQINPINVIYKNEPEWVNLQGTSTSKIPVELGLSPIPDEVLLDDKGNPKDNIEIPEDFETGEGRGYVTWKWNDSQNSEVKVKDKWMKVRIRYTGNKLAIISAIKTLYSISYS